MMHVCGAWRYQMPCLNVLAHEGAHTPSRKYSINAVLGAQPVFLLRQNAVVQHFVPGSRQQILLTSVQITNPSIIHRVSQGGRSTLHAKSIRIAVQSVTRGV